MAAKALVGLNVTFSNDVLSQYDSAVSCGFSFIGIDLLHPKAELSDGSHKMEQYPPFVLTRPEAMCKADGKSIARALLGRISPAIDADTEDPVMRCRFEKSLLKQLSWAAYLGLPAVSIRICRPSNPHLARCLVEFYHTEYAATKIWLVFPMTVNVSRMDEQSDQRTENGEQENIKYFECLSLVHMQIDPWHWWLELSTLAADAVDAIGIVLEVPSNLPDEAVISRWLSEPVVCLAISTDLFLTNSKGYPFLSKAHQKLLQRFFKLDVQILITGACRNDRGYATYQQYITWLWKNKGDPNLYEQHSQGLEDVLQEPLQPLRDNLSSTTYEVFEMDPYKYEAYEMAIYSALVDRSRSGLVQPSETDASVNGVNETNATVSHLKPQVVAILGAGRGPLVKAALSAAQRANCPARVYVVEKNPNALLTLHEHMRNLWRDKDVHLVEGDMREIELPEKADIFVSELLGSFGDNELSPECLDGAQSNLKDDGISIPCSYTSYIAPIQSLHIWKEIKKSRDIASSRLSQPQETPYVVRLHNCHVLTTPQSVFTFAHPKRDLCENNSRYRCCTFKVYTDAVVHGLAGFFEAVLYNDITLSTLPSRHSPNMFSWFPLLFPLTQPVQVNTTEAITVHIWRRINPHHVWYEWTLTEPRATRIHNAAGQAYKIAL